MSNIAKQTVTIDLPYFIDIITKCAKLEVEIEKKNDDYSRLYCENLRLKEQLKEATACLKEQLKEATACLKEQLKEATA